MKRVGLLIVSPAQQLSAGANMRVESELPKCHRLNVHQLMVEQRLSQVLASLVVDMGVNNIIRESSQKPIELP
jgi:hypothetical protein